MRHFWGSSLFAVVGLSVCFWRGGGEALFVCAVLAVMEVSLSFDNAVVNAKVLKEMSPFWQRMFLTVGIFIAVFAVRFVLPIVLVSVASGQDLSRTAHQALSDPVAYHLALSSCETTIAAFGGMFLLLLFLNFVFDIEREHHWIGPIERRLAKFGKLDTIAIFVALLALLGYVHLLPKEMDASALTAGIVGIALYVILDDLKTLTSPADDGTGLPVAAVRNGLVSFLYLEVLDASFSLDGVVGAFAISKSILVIMLGLAVGAVFVRSLTVYLVERGTLSKYVYLEHGAMWAIGALALMMLIGALPNYHMPEWITGLTGALLILASFFSSKREAKRRERCAESAL